MVYARPHINDLCKASRKCEPHVIPLECNIDVTSLKVISQMTRYSMIQTIQTFLEFNARPRTFT